MEFAPNALRMVREYAVPPSNEPIDPRKDTPFPEMKDMTLALARDQYGDPFTLAIWHKDHLVYMETFDWEES